MDADCFGLNQPSFPRANFQIPARLPIPDPARHPQRIINQRTRFAPRQQSSFRRIAALGKNFPEKRDAPRFAHRVKQSARANNQGYTFQFQLHPINARLGQIRTFVAKMVKRPVQFHVTYPATLTGCHPLQSTDLLIEQLRQLTRTDLHRGAAEIFPVRPAGMRTRLHPEPQCFPQHTLHGRLVTRVTTTRDIGQLHQLKQRGCCLLGLAFSQIAIE